MTIKPPLPPEFYWVFCLTFTTLLFWPVALTYELPSALFPAVALPLSERIPRLNRVRVSPEFEDGPWFTPSDLFPCGKFSREALFDDVYYEAMLFVELKAPDV